MGLTSNKDLTSAQYLQKYFIGDNESSPANVNDRNYRLNTLCLAIIRGDLATVKNQLEAGNVDINGMFHCCTPLLYATYAVRKNVDNAEDVLSLILEQEPNLKEHPGAEIDSLDSDWKNEDISTSPVGNVLLIEDEAKREEWYMRLLDLGVSLDHRITYMRRGQDTSTSSLLGILTFNDPKLLQKTMDHYGNNLLQLFENKEIFFEAAEYTHFQQVFSKNYDDFLNLCIKHGCPPSWASKYEAAVAKKKREMSKEALEKLVHETPPPTFASKPTVASFSPFDLCRAIRVGDLEQVRAQLKKKDADIDLKDLECIPPILHATYAARMKVPNAQKILHLILEKNPKLEGIKWNEVGGGKMIFLLNSFLEPDVQSKQVDLSPLGNILEIEDEKLRGETYSRFLEMGIDPTRTLDSYQVKTTKSSRKKYCKIDSAKLEQACLVSRLVDRKDLLEKTLNHFNGNYRKLFKGDDAFMIAFELITSETCNYESRFSENIEDLVALHNKCDWNAQKNDPIDLSRRQARWDALVKKWQEELIEGSLSTAEYESFDSDIFSA